MSDASPPTNQGQLPNWLLEGLPSFPRPVRHEYESSPPLSYAKPIRPATYLSPYTKNSSGARLRRVFAMEESAMLTGSQPNNSTQWAAFSRAIQSRTMPVDPAFPVQESVSLGVAANSPQIIQRPAINYSSLDQDGQLRQASNSAPSASEKEWNYDDAALNLNNILEETTIDVLERASICLKKFAENKAIETSDVVRGTRMTPVLNKALQETHERLRILASTQSDNDRHSTNTSHGPTALEIDQICSSDTARLRRNRPRLLAGRGARFDAPLPQTDDGRKADVRRIRDSMLNTIGFIDIGNFCSTGVNPDSKLLYANRIDIVCSMLARRKHYSTYIVNGDMVRIWWLAGDPKHVEARVPRNLLGNEKKQKFTKIGRELAEMKSIPADQQAEEPDDTTTLILTLTSTLASATRISGRTVTQERKPGGGGLNLGDEDEEYMEVAENTGRKKKNPLTRSASRLVRKSEIGGD
ncbi:uncharacterized protein BDZ99DRAFT_528112 [Mytilinidion resinicola]|uniref:Uncharacterized protein n=1 Tax=Mytilinidion resinicola TaxID=574789 RepID=A0A6A6XZC0_9PEZI|nr:uncharacterized protein BDZ99DRAFT_528112 [Mytilinidion resinicola]KAF2801638.1 hypothetical protein BDZ99DRAFT_528112 [Mytilinidion resinicola]